MTNSKRQEQYYQSPSVDLLQEINDHSTSITRAEGCTNVHTQRIIKNFKTLIKYDDNFNANNNALRLGSEHEDEITNKCKAEIEKYAIEIKHNDEITNNSKAEIEMNEMAIKHNDEITNNS